MTASQPHPQLKHHQIAAELRQMAAALPAMTRLPPERALAERFACSVLTVRKGLSQLVLEGRIVRRTGSGTFVAPTSGAPRGTPIVKTPATTPRLGLLVHAATGSYGHSVIQALGQAATDAEVAIQSAWVADYGDEALAQAKALAKAGCQALVLPWFAHQLSGVVADFVRASPLPVSLPLLIPGLERHCFERPDRFGQTTLSGVAALCHYFRRLGHSRIALLGPDEPADPMWQARLSAYTSFANRQGLAQICGLLGPTADSADALAARWQGWRGDLAIISYDDAHALRLLTAMHKLGRTAPADFAILGFNNSEASRTCDPPLSTVCQDFDYLGRSLLRSALALARGQVWQSPAAPPPRLLVRASCGGAERLTPELVAELATHGLSLSAEARVALALT